MHRAPDRLNHFKESLVILARIGHLVDSLRLTLRRLKVLREYHLLVVIVAKEHVRFVTVEFALGTVQVRLVEIAAFNIC